MERQTIVIEFQICQLISSSNSSEKKFLNCTTFPTQFEAISWIQEHGEKGREYIISEIYKVQ
jgi:hypothetical protein